MKISPKYVFLHLFVIVMLYASAVSFTTLLFQYTNHFVPDPLSNIGYEQNYYFDLIRVALSAIIIVFPIFILSSWFLNKEYIKNPSIREMKIRKWLIYFTLFAAGVIITIDLTRIVWVFLGGEITIRFILKALSVLFVAALIFGYYLWDVKKEVGPYPKKFKYFVSLIILIILITAITGFFVIGSPTSERNRRFDQQRTNNLQEIQYQIVNYWQKKEVLPDKLSDLEDKLTGWKSPLDPQTQKDYEYFKTGDKSFQLCAEFNQEAKQDINIMDYNWNHTKGRVCFDRIIDEKLYPPLKKID